MKVLFSLFFSLKIMVAGCVDASALNAAFIDPVKASYKAADKSLSSNVKILNKIVDLTNSLQSKKLNEIQNKIKLLDLKDAAISSKITDLLKKISKESK